MDSNNTKHENLILQYLVNSASPCHMVYSIHGNYFNKASMAHCQVDQVTT
jgi:hypothetical protein